MESKFEEFKKKHFELLVKAGVDIGNCMVCPYELILEADLKEVSDRVMFRPISWHGSKRFITEILLNQQDIFICHEWGLFLLNTDGESDIKFEEHTYPDPMYFNKQEVEEAGIFYNADLSFVVNNLIVLPAVRTDKFKIPIGASHRKQLDISGLLEIEYGYLIMMGTKSIYFNLDLPRKTDWTGSTIRIRLRLSGILIRNAHIIDQEKDEK